MIRLAKTHNLLTGRNKKQVRDGVEELLESGDLVYAFQEANTYLALLRDLAHQYGYRMIVSSEAGRGMKSSVLFVKKTARMLESGVAHSRWTWFGPRLGIKWPGRSIPWAIVDVGDDVVLFACVHAPTGRNGLPANRISFRRFLKRLRKLYKKKLAHYPGLVYAFLGDWNCSAKDRGERTVKNLLIKPLDAKVADPKTKPPIDYMVHNFDEAVFAEGGPDYHSDHHSSSYVLAA